MAYKDVLNGKWYTGVVNEAAKLGLMSGYPDDTFRPKEPITRAEMASLAVRLYYRTNLSEAVAAVVKKNRKKTATIWNIGANGGIQSAGSSVLIEPDLLLTNSHVIDQAMKIVVRSNESDNPWEIKGEIEKQGCVFDEKGWPTPIVPSDKVIDLATVRLARPLTSVQPVVFTNETLRDGEYIVVIGSPLGFEGWSIISRHTKYFWNTDAPINPGNSGGGAFNLKGEFIGTPTQKYVGAEIDCMAGIIRSEAAKLWIEGKYDEIEF